MFRYMCLLVALGCVVLSVPAATKKDEKENVAWMDAGKADAKRAFANQAKSAPAPGAIPLFIGEYLWSGRADDKYKPFFMFELRLQGAEEALSGASYRIVTLNHLRKPLAEGPWINLGNLPRAERRDLSYKLNCTTFPAFQIEMKWKGGQETYLVWDKVATVPVALSEVAKTSFLIALNQLFEHNGAKKSADVSYMLWNIGGVAAKDVEQTINFKNEAGKIVHAHTYKPNKGEVPSGYVGEQKLKLSKVPPFSTISISTKTTDISTLDPGSFTGAKDIEVADVKAEGNNLKAKVRNGLSGKVAGLSVIINLIERNGKSVKKIKIPVGDVEQNQIVPVTADITGVKSWAGYEVSWESAELPTNRPKQNAENAQNKKQELEVDGLVFVISKTKTTSTGIDISGELENRRDNDLANLVISFSVPNGAKDSVVVTLKPGTLNKGEKMEVNFTADGVKAFAGLSLKWVAKN